MSPFKATILAALVALTACKPKTTVDGVNGPNREDGSPGATFFVYDGDGDGRVGKVVSDSKWPVPLTADFSFVACMRDRASAAVARGQKFEVEIPETGQRIVPDAPSSELGCINWREQIPFNFYAKRSAPIEVVRRVVGVGVHTGFFAVHYAIDPWAVGDQARDVIKPVQFLKRISPPPNMVTDPREIQATLSGDKGGADIWISKLEFAVLDRQDFSGYSKMDFQIKMNPFVEWLNNDGVPSFKRLENGEFEVFAQLVATDTGPKQDQKMILTTTQMSTFTTVKNGDLLATLSTNLDRMVSIGNVVLVLRLVPRGFGQARLLERYEAIYELGDIHKMQQAQLAQACVDHTAACGFDKFLQSASNYDSLTASHYAFANDRFSFSSLKLRFVTVATTPAETATQRTVSYSATTCVTDRRTGTRVFRTPFHVQYVKDDGSPADPSDPYQSQALVTDDEGCLHWLANQWHQYYMQEHFFPKKVHITMGGTNAGTTIAFRLNPWDDKFTFGFDDRELSKDFIDATSNPQDKPKSLFFTAGYDYHTIRFLYNFDENMSLQVKKTVLLEVDPRVLRYSGIVNARRTTEGLRDGIYLMKVAIQKDYLDPTTAGVKILGDPRDVNHVRSVMSPSSQESAFEDIRKRDYVTTSTQLVRVVDGRLIKPVELTMLDLRLMRMRTNFLIELETVDEQLVSANQAFQNEYDREVKKYRQEFDSGKDNRNLTEAQRQKKYDDRATETQKKLKQAWDQLGQFLAAKKNNPDTNISLSNYDIPEELLKPIAEILKVNNFTQTKMPDCEETDCERFVEKNSGLDPRTFVGPMIFLSNAYSDSVRPTDNLDEACHRPDDPYLKGEGGEEDWFGRREQAEQTTRRNKWYVYSKYYGAMTYLCDKSVDELIVEEKKQRQEFKSVMDQYKTLPSFVANANADFAILNDANAAEYSSADNLLTGEKILDLVNSRHYMVAPPLFMEQGTSFDIGGPTALPRVSPSDLATVFFDNQEFDLEREKKLALTPAQQVSICNVLSNRLREQMGKFHIDYSGNAFSNFFSKIFGRNAPFSTPDLFVGTIFQRCVDRGPASVFVDSRLRVFETGPDYTFKGGLQLNLNVGESFSLSQSNSTGMSASFDAVDLTTSVVGLGALLFTRGAVAQGVAGAVLIHLLRPFSGRGSESTGFSSSEGTTISNQTYLVSQMAKFDVELTKYELCRIFRFSRDLMGSDFWVDYGNLDPSFVNENGVAFGQIFDRGVAVCTGQPIQKSLHVPEDYFYFTQHFTEGDMLDQADLINNPWLLQLRGDRDFVVFLRAIKAQHVVNKNDFEYGLGSDPEVRPVDWPLEHMAHAYSQTAPSHPGFYTILREPLITQFPVGNQIINLKEDVNGEMCSDPNGCDKMPIQSSPPNVSHTDYPGPDAEP